MSVLSKGQGMATTITRADAQSGARPPGAARLFPRWVFLGVGTVLLLGATLVTYWPAVHAGFVVDDNIHLLNNPVFERGGLGRTWLPWGNIAYWPLTFTMFWAEGQLWTALWAEPDLWKRASVGFHAVNIALHAACALLLWRVLAIIFQGPKSKDQRRAAPGGNVSGPTADSLQPTAFAAWLAAAIFALHPVNVESVAWVSQLKGLLSLLLTLLAVMAYIGHDQRGGWWRWGLAIVFFLLAALAKGAGLTVPAVLLALAWWWRGRLTWRDVLHVVPLILIGAVMAGIEVWRQPTATGVEIVRDDNLLGRTAVAGWAVWFYAWKLTWPLNVCAVYPRWSIDPRIILAYLPGTLGLGILVLAWLNRQRWGRPVVLLGACYTALLLPVLGWAPIYAMQVSLVADHWQYVAMIVPVAVLAGSLRAFLSVAPRADVGQTRASCWTARPSAWGIGPVLGSWGAAVVALLGLGVLAFAHAETYRDAATTFYPDVLRKNPDCWMAEGNWAAALVEAGQSSAAIAHDERALRLNPSFAFAHNNLGDVLARMGQWPQAVAHYKDALRLRPEMPTAHYGLGMALLQVGQRDEGIEELKKALEYQKDYADAHGNLANALVQAGRPWEAIAHHEQALRMKPSDPDVLNNFAWFLATREPQEGGDPARAIHLAYRACAMSTNGGNPLYLGTLAAAYASAGRFDEAIDTAAKGAALARATGQEGIAQAIEGHLAGYRAGQPWRERLPAK
jgi:tetratricopeptide (TPR) repeat protein